MTKATYEEMTVAFFQMEATRQISNKLDPNSREGRESHVPAARAIANFLRVARSHYGVSA